MVLHTTNNITYFIVHTHTENVNSENDIICEVNNRYEASKALINKGAMYSEVDGVLRQFMSITTDYKSINDIQDIVYRTGKLIDGEDTYKLVEKTD